MFSIGHGEIEEGNQSWVNSFTSWLMRSSADDVDAGLEQALLADHPIFENLFEIQRFLYVKGAFAGVQSALDPWMTPLAAGLGEWVDKVVRHVIESKYENNSADGWRSPRLSPRYEKLEFDESIVGPEAI